MTDDEFEKRLTELESLSERRQSLFDQLVREDNLRLECAEEVEMEQVEAELGCKARQLLPAVRERLQKLTMLEEDRRQEGMDRDLADRRD